MIDFEAARTRIAPYVARTPLVTLRAGAIPPFRGIVDVPVSDPRLQCDLLLKLESLQASGSFKARGALNRVLSLRDDVRARGLVTASGGNHGLAVAYAGHVTGAKTVVYLPSHTSAAKAARIERWGAKVERAGEVWDDAHAAGLAHAAREGMTYIHPFADEDVIAGAGTLALEILEEAPDVDLFIVAIGGGGLISGVASAAAGRRVIGVEPTGAPTLFESVAKDEVVELARIETKAGTLAPRKSHATNLAIIRERVERIVLVTDDAMIDAARFLLKEVGIGAELSGAAALAAVLSGAVDLTGAKRPCALVCGAGSDALL